MKKLLLFIVFMLIATTAQAENTSWIKGGLSLFEDEIFCTDNYDLIYTYGLEELCGNNFNGKNFFIQASPVNIRGKLNGSKLGYRVEPWMGYSQTGNTDFVGGIEDGDWVGGQLEYWFQTKISNLTVKNFQFGTNLFLDFEVLPDFTIYGGPVAGFEISQISAKVEHFNYELDTATGVVAETKRGGHNNVSEWDSNFIYGAEVGGEYKITKNVALGAFAGFLQHGAMVHGNETLSEWNQGAEIRAGTGLTFYW